MSEEQKPPEENQEQKPPQEDQKAGEEVKKETKNILDFIKPEVAQQLQDMGYSKNASEKACLFTQSNLDRALDWLSEHQGDPDFDEPAQIEVSMEQKPKMSKEEAAIKAKELQQKMRKMHEEKQKEMDREHERLRIQNAKEMAKAREAEKERQAKLFVEQKKKEKKKMLNTEDKF